MWKAKKMMFAAVLAIMPLFPAVSAFAQDDPPVLVARIGDTQGDVSFMAAGATDWSQGLANYPMTSGDRLYCDQNSRAEIGAGETDVRLWEYTDVTLTNLTSQYEQIGLATGAIRVRIYGLNPGSTVEVDTPNGSAVITQPGDYRFDAFPNDGGSDAIVNAGALQITGPDGTNQELTAGMAVQMTGTNPIQLTSLNLPPFDSLDQWSINRDHQILNSQSAQYVSRQTPGYADLDAAGTWSPSPEYGPVWYPTQVPIGWRPYSSGHWAYVAPWGYTWVDDAPWGYAPFHYGRWVYATGRWGWVPGPPTVAPVYSPALVAFVGGGGFSIGVGFGGGGGVAAWFPLGVGEPFIPWYHVSNNYVHQVNVTNVNVTNIHNTTIINNYNTFITNTRTINNVNQINTNNIQYQNRAQVTAVPAAAMSTGRPVTQAAVKLTPQQQQQLATAPVHAAPSAPAPTRPLLAAKTNVKAPAAAPTLVTPRGLAKATPAANPAHLAPVNLPKPKPATALPKPVPGAVAGKPVTAQPAAARAVAPTPAKPAAEPTKPATATTAKPAMPETKPATAKPAAPSEVKPVTTGSAKSAAPETAKPKTETERPAAEHQPSKPAEARPEESNPQQAKPAEAKPEQPKPTEAKPAPPRPAARPAPKPKPAPPPEHKPEEKPQ
jgi:hypothetical protein